MNTLTDNVIRKLFVIFSCAILVVGSITVPKISAENVSKYSDEITKYSGEEIFRGVMLGQGPVGELFKNEWGAEQLEENNNKESLEYVDKALTEMSESDKSYFHDLQDAVYSQDYLKTKKLLNHGAEMFMAVIKEDVSVGEIHPNAGLFLGLYAVAIATTAVALSHAVWLTFYLEEAAAGPGLDSTNSELQEDIIIDKLITELN